MPNLKNKDEINDKESIKQALRDKPKNSSNIVTFPFNVDKGVYQTQVDSSKTKDKISEKELHEVIRKLNERAIKSPSLMSLILIFIGILLLIGFFTCIIVYILQISDAPWLAYATVGLIVILVLLFALGGFCVFFQNMILSQKGVNIQETLDSLNKSTYEKKGMRWSLGKNEAWIQLNVERNQSPNKQPKAREMDHEFRDSKMEDDQLPGGLIMKRKEDETRNNQGVLIVEEVRAPNHENVPSSKNFEINDLNDEVQDQDQVMFQFNGQSKDGQKSHRERNTNAPNLSPESKKNSKISMANRPTPFCPLSSQVNNEFDLGKIKMHDLQDVGIHNDQKYKIVDAKDIELGNSHQNVLETDLVLAKSHQDEGNNPMYSQRSKNEARQLQLV